MPVILVRRVYIAVTFFLYIPISAPSSSTFLVQNILSTFFRFFVQNMYRTLIKSFL